MLERIDDELERLLRRAVPLPDSDVDVSFGWPGDLAQASMRRPTVSLFLWDAHRDLERSMGGVQSVRSSDGALLRKNIDPYLRVHYLITVWCERESDEHRLLGRLLGFLLTRPVLRVRMKPGAAYVDAVMWTERPDSRRLDAVWSGMDNRLRPAVDLVIGVQVDVLDWVEAPPGVQDIAVVARPEGGRGQ